jgi:alkylated DNA repair dioxygenase AlkB
VELDRLTDAISVTAEKGYCHVPGGLEPVWRQQLRNCAALDWRTLPEKVGEVRQTASAAILHREFPAPVALFADAVQRAVSDGVGAEFEANEATFMRYVGRSSGISPHRDHRDFRVIVAIASLLGQAIMCIHGSRSDDDVIDRFRVSPGDLVFLRGVGLVDSLDPLSARPIHSVSAPVNGTRVSLSLRMAPNSSGGRRPVQG